MNYIFFYKILNGPSTENFFDIISVSVTAVTVKERSQSWSFLNSIKEQKASLANAFSPTVLKNGIS